ncbi:MAG TPA: peptidoglycan editing factor PgeF [Candidatus Rifleibacterium sp.]|nr:peptidoglycan editing factor PgeF [Candidatus Rifleibacterium sp.]
MKIFEDQKIIAGFSEAFDGDLSFYNMSSERAAEIWQNLPVVRENAMTWPTYGHQVHQDRVFQVTEDTPLFLTEKTDGLITNLADRPIGVFSADCLPLLIWCDRAVAAVHAGWRSACMNIATRAVERFSDLFQVEPADLKTLIGPCIGQCCLEMGDEVYQQFVEADPVWQKFFKKNGKWHLDLRGLNRWQLLQAGVPEAGINDFDHCTYCSEKQFFSFRRQRQRNGSMFSFIVRKSR